MRLIARYYLLLFIALNLYYHFSKLLFDNVYDTLQTVIDELFHIPQGLAYCKGDFSYWNSKITTLPGLYIISAGILGQRFTCTNYNLRFINLLASCVNLFLFASILKYVYGNLNYGKNLVQAVNMALLPPLYFFSHVYYTETLSLTFLLAFSRLCLNNKYKSLILLFGILSVLMRQTNIVWVAMVFGHKVLDIFIKSSRVYGNQLITKVPISRTSLIAKDIDRSLLKRYYGLADCVAAIIYHVSTCCTTFYKYLTLQDLSVIFTHSVTLLSFVAFVIWNGSIVVGDKNAHEACIHLPQMLYFLIFYGVFGLPHVINKFYTTLRVMYYHKYKVVLFTILFTVIVHYNTLVHPYLLADNRHFTFYIWNRWFGKYEYVKYAMVPAYVFLMYSLYDNLRLQNCISFLLPFTISLFLGVALNELVEIRYFLIPFIVLRLRFSRPPNWVIGFESVWCLILNVVTFYVFFTKEVAWKDFDYPQRIIW